MAKLTHIEINWPQSDISIKLITTTANKTVDIFANKACKTTDLRKLEKVRFNCLSAMANKYNGVIIDATTIPNTTPKKPKFIDKM